MFSGIIEGLSAVTNIQKNGSVVRLGLARPADFQDLKIGDSIAVNGICLTIETLDPENIYFALAPETLRVTGWQDSLGVGSQMNLERSLRYGDRLHGHLVTGHVDTLGSVVQVENLSESKNLEIRISNFLPQYIWEKGSVAINGVSLTVNKVNGANIQVCLIPETLKRTNLQDLAQGDQVQIEYDYFAKAIFQGRGAYELSR